MRLERSSSIRVLQGIAGLTAGWIATALVLMIPPVSICLDGATVRVDPAAAGIADLAGTGPSIDADESLARLPDRDPSSVLASVDP